MFDWRIFMVLVASASAWCLTPGDWLPKATSLDSCATSLTEMREAGGCWVNETQRCPNVDVDFQDDCPCDSPEDFCLGMDTWGDRSTLEYQSATINIHNPWGYGLRASGESQHICYTMKPCFGYCQYATQPPFFKCPKGRTLFEMRTAWPVDPCAQVPCNYIAETTPIELVGYQRLRAANGIGTIVFAE